MPIPKKRQPASDIDTATADSLKVLDPKRPIREADSWPVAINFTSGPDAPAFRVKQDLLEGDARDRVVTVAVPGLPTVGLLTDQRGC